MYALIFADTMLFLSTLSLRRATLRVVDGSKSSIISIHALLAESDPLTTRHISPLIISIHALLAESDADRGNRLPGFQIFLSTLSLRRATHGCYSLRHSA